MIVYLDYNHPCCARFGSVTTRRTFLQGMATAALAAPSRRPNVLYIVTDDQRWDLLSLRGHPFVRTPHMDSIGRQGVLFLNSFVTTSLCSPSRASNGPGATPINTAFAPMAHRPHSTRPSRRSRCSCNSTGIAPGMSASGTSATTPVRGRGFDSWRVLPGQGVYFDPVFNLNGKEQQIKGHVDQVVAGFAADFLKQQDSRKPFCLCVGIKSPHAEQLPPPRLVELFAGTRIPKPPTWMQDVLANGKADVVKKACIQAAEFFDGPLKMKGSYDRYIKDFYRSVMSADDAVGTVLEALEKLARPTIPWWYSRATTAFFSASTAWWISGCPTKRPCGFPC